MNYYSFGNPQGTSNSEYGKFNSCSRGGQGLGGTQSAYSLTGGGQNNQNVSSWNTQKSIHSQYLGRGNQQFQHYAGCPNLNCTQQGGAEPNWYQGQGGDDGSNNANYTVQIGHEAAAAALGGKANYESMMSSMQYPQNMTQVQVQEFSQPLESNGGQGEQGSEGPEKIQSRQESQAPSEVPQNDSTSNDNTNAQSTPSQDKPEAPTKPKYKPAKWRGLPNRGDVASRHILPSRMRQNQNQMQMQMSNNGPSSNMQNNLECQLQQQYGQQGMTEMTPSHSNGNNISNSMSRLSLKGKQSGAAAPTPSNTNLANNNKRAQLSRTPAQLCGKCTKCKNLLPPDLGPSTMTFPTKAGLRKPTSQSFHNLGQDAKNFRAIRYTHHNMG